MRTKKGGFLRGMLQNMTKRLPIMTRSRRVQPSSMLPSSMLPSSMLPTTIIEEIADELPPQSRRQSRTKTPAQTEREAQRDARTAQRDARTAQREARTTQRDARTAQRTTQRTTQRDARTTQREAQRDAQRDARTAQREARAKTRASRTKVASRPKVASPEAQEFIKQYNKTQATIEPCSNEIQRLQQKSDANVLKVMDMVEEAQAKIDRIEGKKGGKKSRTHRKPKRARK